MVRKKNKNIDERLDDYIKNYRITFYQKEYNYLLKYEFISNYRPSCSNGLIQKWIYELLYEEPIKRRSLSCNVCFKYFILHIKYF